jgi:glycosyltransferase involved in cell wall biosynthesis
MLAIENLWRQYAYKTALRLIDQWKCEAILSTSPPPACHLLAIDLKQKTGLPAILDYRDSWTDNPHGKYPTRWHRLHSCKLEKYVQQNADKVVTVSKAVAKQIHSIVPVIERPWLEAQIIPNGYDPFDFADLNISARPYVVSHIGSIYRGRVPVALHLVESLASLEQIDPILSGKLVLRFIGILDPLVEVALRTRLKRICIELIGSVSHDEAIRHMYEASLLLLITDYIEMGSTTSKVFEYLATNRPILSVGHSESVRDLLTSLPDCMYVSGDFLPETIDAFRKLITICSTGQLPESKIHRQAILAQYTRRSFTHDLAKLLNVVTIK